MAHRAGNRSLRQARALLNIAAVLALAVDRGRRSEDHDAGSHDSGSACNEVEDCVGAVQKTCITERWRVVFCQRLIMFMFEKLRY